MKKLFNFETYLSVNGRFAHLQIARYISHYRVSYWAIENMGQTVCPKWQLVLFFVHLNGWFKAHFENDIANWKRVALTRVFTSSLFTDCTKNMHMKTNVNIQFYMKGLSGVIGILSEN